MKNWWYAYLAVIFVIVFAASGCRADENGAIAVGTHVVTDGIEPTATIVPTETPLPTATPQPSLVVLYTPANVNEQAVAAWQERLSSLAQTAGLSIESRSVLSEDDIAENWQIVVMPVYEDSLSSLAGSAPNTLFVVVTDAILAGLPTNVVQLVADPYAKAFAAGNTVIHTAADWRLGALLPGDSNNDSNLNQAAFINGVNYYCGKCGTAYSPLFDAPLIATLPSDSSGQAWIEALSELHRQYILRAVFVSEAASSDELFSFLAEIDMIVVGEQKPAGIEGLRWAVTIRQDSLAVFEQNWTELVSRSIESNIILVPVEVVDVDENLLSIGRMRLIEETIDAVADGWVLPLSPDFP
jgi:hypothetical protein